MLILGALGCGAFKNLPEIVAKASKNMMQNHAKYFDVIEYAVFHTEREITNREAFSDKMK